MPKRVKRHLEELVSLKKATPKRRKCILENCSPQLVDCLAECASNCLNNGLPLEKAQFAKLKRYKKILRQIASKKVSRKTKKKHLVQKGGFIVPLITAVLSALASNLLR
jgi:hypothetical protein